MEIFIKTLLALSLGGTAVTLLLLLVNRFLGKRVYRGFIYYAWLLVLLRFVLPVPGLLRMPAARTVPEPAAAVQTASVQTAAAQIASQTAYVEKSDLKTADGQSVPDAAHQGTEEMTGTADNSAVSEGMSAAGETLTAPAQTSAAAPEAGADAAKQPFPCWLAAACVWAAGAAGSAVWSLYGYFRYRKALYRTLKPARESDLRALSALNSQPWPVLYRSGVVTTPLLMGPVRPVIILPDRDYTPEMLNGILRHELTHYRRGDLIVKWFAAGVCCVHWFNPAAYLIRPALDRACELSCDERLLRNMDKREKQNYGELLLELAANKPLPGRVVAVSFATEKRNLKERLVQIMTFKKKGAAALCIMLAVLVMLAGCATAMGPSGGLPEDPFEGQTSDGDIQEIYVDDADSFIAALGSGRKIIMRDGTYDLTAASNYGFSASPSYYWNNTYDGYELVLSGLDDLTIASEHGADAVSIVTQPRYANVLRLENCRNVTIDGITAGHTIEQGACSGGVLYCENCDGMYVSGSVLYGCGTIGISAVNCRSVFADSTVIKECSYGAIFSQGCYDVRFTNGKIFACGLKDDGAFNMLDVLTTTGFAVHNTEIYGNEAQLLLNSDYSFGVELRGCRVHDNRLGVGITIAGNPAVIDGCSFGGNSLESGQWYTSADYPAKDTNGDDLSDSALDNMEYAEYTGSYDGPTGMPAAPVSTETAEDGRAVYHITTVDELLGALGSDRIIYIDADRLDLSGATSYGGFGGPQFCWEETYDGPQLVITGVNDMSIIGKGKDRTTIETAPRYADVLAFVNCSGITLEGFTAGHIRGMGECSGDVITFQSCNNCTLSGCGLFGCGVNGFDAFNCYNIAVRDTDIYECSGFGAIISDCSAVSFEGCTIRDCGVSKIAASDSYDLTWDGKTPEDLPDMFIVGGKEIYYTDPVTEPVVVNDDAYSYEEPVPESAYIDGN